MSNQELLELLLRSDSEDEVIEILTEAGLWNDTGAWRFFGDNENNYSSIGNQQGEPVPALIEKLVNSVDARLIDACLVAGVSTDGGDAPSDIRAAVAQFFEADGEMASTEAGRIAEWPDEKAKAEADLLTLAATGFTPRSGLPSLTIADQGEGQMPDQFPYTFMSLQRSNKLRVPFVQGKFNMGGTGALQFCSPNHRLQLVLSRRNPGLVDFSENPRDHQWGFTIVRREAPSEGMRSSVFSYLAPHGVEAGRDGNVLSFPADEMPIFPEANSSVRDAYHRTSEYGSLVKLYEYALDGTKSNIVSSGGGLLRRVDFGMPETALPIRLYECRPQYAGHSGSHATSALGIVARLDRNRTETLEPGFPVGHLMRLEGRDVRLRAFALKASAKEYRSGQNALIFSINGQTHATKTTEFFRRKKVGLSQLADSLIVVVDCSEIEGQLREDMFMNSRDRLRSTSLSREMETGIEQFLKNDEKLRELKNRRRQEEIANRLDEAQPLSDALANLVASNPGLSRLLGAGPRISAPFPNTGTGRGGDGVTFEGKRFPTYFRHRKKPDIDELTRDAHLGSTVRLAFETDVVDDYLHRDVEPGAVEVDIAEGSGAWLPLDSMSFTGPASGVCHLALQVPAGLVSGDSFRLRIRVTDPSRIDALELTATLNVRPKAATRSGTNGRDKHRNTGTGNGESSSGLALPNVIPVREDDWSSRQFDEYSAVAVVGQGEDENGVTAYDFYVNYDNWHLNAALKAAKGDTAVYEHQFVYSLVLYSMALLVKSPADPGAEISQTEEDRERAVRQVTRQLAAFVLPTLEAMAAVADE